MLLRLLVFTLFLTVMNVFSQTPTIETGVPNTLAKWRATNYSDVRYKLNITLEKGAQLMKGEIEIRATLTDEGAKNNLILDWRTTQFANDKDRPYANVVAVNNAVDVISTVVKEHLIVPKDTLKTGENVIKIQFASPIKTSGAAITRYIDKEDGAEYVYSLFVPSDASTAFPVFDQPDLKARFNLSIKTFGKVISNAEPKRIQNLPISHSEDWKKGLSITDFEETEPISTYVFAFAVGDFAEFEERFINGTIRERIYVRKSQAEKFKPHAVEVARLNYEGVKFLESYFDYKFPFPKYDLVLIPEFPFGGMEHAGATFLREDRIIFPTEPTKNDFVTRANLIFHEAAHQWFGDMVTMRWFDDLWLKEGFAEFMAYKTLDKVMPEYNAWKIFYERNKQLAYLTDATRGTTPIYQEIPNLASAKSAYGNIVYRKAPSFLKQAEFLLGKDKFQNAVRAFLKKHQFANAEWTDLVKEFETASQYNLKNWANGWVKQRGVPIIKLGSNSVSQKDALIDNSLWTQKFKIYQFEKNQNPEYKDLVSIDTFTLGKPTQPFSISEKASFIFPNYQDYGYGIFLLDEKSRDYVTKNIQNEKDDFLRTMLWGSLWDSVRETELAPKDYVELIIKNINVETDESTIQTLLGRVSTAMNYYLSDAQHEELAPKIETVLIQKMQKAPTLGQRITFYRAFLNIASSEKTRTVLKNILSGKFKIEGLNCRGDSCGRPMSEAKVSVGNQTTESSTKISDVRRFGQAQDLPLQNAPTILKTKDKFDIVTKLLILGDKDAPSLLAELEKTETTDEAKRYAYAAKAGIAAAESKAKFWNDFINNKDVSESWIESAFVPFNSVRHSELTLPYLERVLAELPNLKRNRKIFFVNGWLAAFVGGQRSEQALAVVNKFLADNPNLDKDLHLKILETVDGLERAVKIRRKFVG
ncbi:MAG: ERAP1-like C-terminal domain-containing protein [Acidobacteriota bacterium]|nr:ERAP1-like C-terminal domain-containing protein [Acidobacteriota bacterium]